ncbi:hypothetical protein FT663_01501 [Candidozyma haemuli var. vulneris]|uniref:Antiviral helicase SKI2 n=1 Tax=Candidozyma haemuli TaxID=45357 RepID=A0A2V1ASG6_9ASCO|nr:hypothetical protein CXQ85_000122 [[Candida] haemuloni]KAF3990129.1 hypothetical protein FT662_02453 [[Candida] haemuloni var. vulneris]KAF3994381.1 hypothetical protein FT663_01501 [[Candida] haemuloni var. vulneris]PVH21157.1 hypothetical protein CXQ85_000122 [[Candida] haemuloni]
MALNKVLDPSEILDVPPSDKSSTDLLSAQLLEPSNHLTWDVQDLIQSKPSIDKQRIFESLLVQPEPIKRSSFRFKRSGLKGEIVGYKEEIKISEVDNATSANSLSINRKYGSKQDATSGKSNYLPFQPGGLFSGTSTNQALNTKQHLSEFQFLHKNNLGLFDVPPGFSRGLNISGAAENSEGVHELDSEGEDVEESPKEDGEPGSTDLMGNVGQDESNGETGISEIDDLIPLDYMKMKAKMESEQRVKRNWAHVVDLDHKIENFQDVVPNMAREWPFELDTFQKEAVYHLEQGDSVFVAAHTSAGKTVVAEYAIAMAARNMTKTIYTSPIKALSNQKFRDFKETFKDMEIGLITGDVQINPEANCLIMTTEILRSMLYRGADLIRDVEFVIFDEVHYVNDIDRGVVWEEVIIMLPDHVKYILLSATVPNTFEFANWVGRTKQKDMYVISTPKRPVPLEIFIWGKKNLYKAINAQGVFNEGEFKKYKEALAPSQKQQPPNVTVSYGSRKGPGGTARGGNRGGGQGGRGGGPPGRGGGPSGRGGPAARGRGNLQPRGGFARDGPNKGTWTDLVQYLNSNKLLPAVIFVFSKKRCEDYAATLSGVQFCNAKERSEIHMFIDKAVSRLKKEDRELPQILSVRDMLSRGIAVHHGGLLPIVKECIEILFAKSLVKVLFATETFAMGLNLPTRTVVFSELRKHDGRGFRNLLPGEFTQMAGRAGRRGLDSTGTVIVMSYNDPLSPTDFKEVTMGTPTKLSSQFRLTYNMILNLLRIEALRVEEMIKHSFSENSSQTLLPEHQKKVEALKQELSSTQVEESSQISEYKEAFSIISQYREVYGKIVTEVSKSTLTRTALLHPGKLMCFLDEDGVVRAGFLVKCDLNADKMIFLTFDHGRTYEEQGEHLPYVPVPQFIKSTRQEIRYSGDLRTTSVPFENVQFASSYCLRTNMKKILSNDAQAVKEAESSINNILRVQLFWFEIEFQKAVQLSLHELVNEKTQLVTKLRDMTVYKKPEFKKIYSQLAKRDGLEKNIESLNLLISDENLELLPDYEQRLKVLQALAFIDDQQRVVLKGRVACEINSGWELVLTELILDNFLGDFQPEEIVALLSCFVYEGRTNEEEEPPMTPRLEKGKVEILKITERLLKVYNEHQVSLTSEEEEFLERKRFALVNVVYEWARGLTFSEIMQISVESEGTIVRVITRLDEICRQVKNAALIVGDSTLHSKMNEAQEKIKRDIVFCASLYL